MRLLDTLDDKIIEQLATNDQSWEDEGIFWGSSEVGPPFMSLMLKWGLSQIGKNVSIVIYASNYYNEVSLTNHFYRLSPDIKLIDSGLIYLN